MSKKTIAVLFGGQSSEHEVSCVSVKTIISNINKDDYQVIIIGITKEGRWLLVESEEQISSGSWREGKDTAIISPDTSHKGVVILRDRKAEYIGVDVVFPVLHGLYGEDGTVQGLLQLSGIPYVGCGILASAISMDKLYTKIVVDDLHIRQAQFVGVLAGDLERMNEVVEQVEGKLNYPVFIKPSNAGSSQGVSKAENRQQLEEGLRMAAIHDRKILVEETIYGREVECAVLGGQNPKSSGVGEIVAAAEFYDYEAKYHNQESQTIVSPELPDGVEEEIREAAIKIFRAVDGFGLSRVDFFVEHGTNEVVFNEINTLPGFTSISMYPVLWEAKGIGKAQLIEKLIQSAFTR